MKPTSAQIVSQWPQAEDLTPAELRTEIARLAGLYAHKTCVHDAFTVLMRIAGALEPGGRA